MKIVTYNVNGLRQRVAQHGSLLKLLDALDADIICFQETKLSRQDLSADLTMAQGYEAFFSCTRTTERGRTCYSGVATFARVTSAFSSKEVSLPLAAEEGFTGLLEKSVEKKNNKMDFSLEGMEDIKNKDLLKVDGEGRCIITDHGHFVLINIYGPRADENDAERVRFKHLFFKILQRKWESLFRQGRRVCVVGDFNIAPSAIDCCDPRPGFDENPFRKWLRSLLRESGGSFVDVFRAKHPKRKDAYTCWPQSVGGEEFNYGTRIDLILMSGSCLHGINDDDDDDDGHNFVNCQVRECDILLQFKRGKDSTPRWNGGRGIKLEGSDHAPVYVEFTDLPELQVHSTPSLAARYIPEVHGWQQTIVPLLLKRPPPAKQKTDDSSAENSEVSETSQHLLGSEQESEPSMGSGSTIIGKNKERRKTFQKTIRSFFQTRDSVSNVRAETSSVNACQTSVLVLDEEDGVDFSEGEKNSIALSEWHRIQRRMQTSLPLCKGHKEPCVARFVKKSGPNVGRGFYVCPRAKGPASNPEANCGYFQWASGKTKQKKGLKRFQT